MILFLYFSISIIRYLLTILVSYDLLHLFKILYFYFSHYATILFMHKRVCLSTTLSQEVVLAQA